MDGWEEGRSGWIGEWMGGRREGVGGLVSGWVGGGKEWIGEWMGGRREGVGG